ncbi:MAG: hypothetical protein R3E56_18100 [Burkholderiaceae bacterium]
MNRAAIPSRRSENDPLAVNSTTLHQYYNTVQSEVSGDHLVDAAMARRQAMALQAHRRRGAPRWLAVLAAALLAACVVWLSV